MKKIELEKQLDILLKKEKRIKKQLKEVKELIEITRFNIEIKG